VIDPASHLDGIARLRQRGSLRDRPQRRADRAGVRVVTGGGDEERSSMRARGSERRQNCGGDHEFPEHEFLGLSDASYTNSTHRRIIA
jgi:hypothetical protein